MMPSEEEVMKKMQELGYTTYTDATEIFDIISDTVGSEKLVKALSNENAIFLFNKKEILYLLVKSGKNMTLLGANSPQLMILALIQAPDYIIPNESKTKMIKSIIEGEDISESELVEIDPEKCKDFNHDRREEE